MYPNYSQFPDQAPDPKKLPKKIKSSGGANPYKQLNQMLDFQIKQAKLEKIREKKERKRPPRVKSSECECHSRSYAYATSFL